MGRTLELLVILVLLGTSSAASAQVCGNGAIDAIEECDDGNVDPGDGCGDDCAGELVCLSGACEMPDEPDAGTGDADANDAGSGDADADGADAGLVDAGDAGTGDADADAAEAGLLDADDAGAADGATRPRKLRRTGCDGYTRGLRTDQPTTGNGVPRPGSTLPTRGDGSGRRQR
jgi:cysteine-rich repeat protein